MSLRLMRGLAKTFEKDLRLTSLERIGCDRQAETFALRTSRDAAYLGGGDAGRTLASEIIATFNIRTGDRGEAAL